MRLRGHARQRHGTIWVINAPATAAFYEAARGHEQAALIATTCTPSSSRSSRWASDPRTSSGLRSGPPIGARWVETARIGAGFPGRSLRCNTGAVTHTGTFAHKEDDAVTDIARRLRIRFSQHDPGHVDDVVHAHQQRLHTARIRSFVPILVERASRSTLES